MNEPRWLCRDECLVIHEIMLARHGGLAGAREEQLIESVLAKPRERFAAGCPALPELAASYASAMFVERPFVSGNVCTGFLLALTFMRVNGLLFTGRDLPAAEETLALARGESSESFYAFYLKCNSRAP